MVMRELTSGNTDTQSTAMLCLSVVGELQSTYFTESDLVFVKVSF